MSFEHEVTIYVKICIYTMSSVGYLVRGFLLLAKQIRRSESYLAITFFEQRKYIKGQKI